MSPRPAALDGRPLHLLQARVRQRAEQRAIRRPQMRVQCRRPAASSDLNKPFAACIAASDAPRSAPSSGPASRCSEWFTRASFSATPSAGQRVTSSCALSIGLEYCSRESRVCSRRFKPLPTSDTQSRRCKLFETLARGFESKDVEFQQAEKERVTAPGPELTAAQRDAQAKRRTLELALARARADLAAARTPAHRRMLTDAIAALEQQLAASK